VSLIEEINKRKNDGLFRSRKILDGAQGAHIKIGGREFLNFSSNDYLGLANNSALKSNMVHAINEYGIGAGSSQLVVGHSKPHNMLEKKIASFLNRDRALVFTSGYLANLAIASVMIDSDTVVIQDKLNHASLIDAAQLSKGRLIRFHHKDMVHLKTLLEKNKQHNLLVMTDGVFSMDGDFAPLKEIVGLCEKYNAILIVDDAHGIGVLGETGGGLLEHLNLNQKQVPLLIGTFGKSFGASGAFVSGSSIYIESFIQKARTYIYTTAMLPALAATLCHAIDLVINGSDLRQQINILINYYKRLLKESGLSVSESCSHIQPYIVGAAGDAVRLSESLCLHNILVAAIRPPTVPRDSSRLRISLTAEHTKENVADLVAAISLVK